MAMLDVANFIFSNTTACAINQFTVINQAVSNAFRHVLSVIAHKTHEFYGLLAFDKNVNTGVLLRFWCGIHLGSNGV
jgi:hypothetical protein